MILNLKATLIDTLLLRYFVTAFIVTQALAMCWVLVEARNLMGDVE